ncbi:MAG: PAS domain-containing protein [Desulfamplus sp.]|nr:PAS domain-containing protein [Desulfamplus sp.]
MTSSYEYKDLRNKAKKRLLNKSYCKDLPPTAFHYLPPTDSEDLTPTDSEDLTPTDSEDLTPTDFKYLSLPDEISFSPNKFPHLTPSDYNELIIEEFAVYKQELEIQNEELRRVHCERESLLEEYVGLYYDAAPCGYVTISPKTIITRINETGLCLLKTNRLNCKHMGLSFFIDDVSHMNYFMTLNKVAKTGEAQSIELKLKSQDAWLLACIKPDMKSSGEFYQWRITLVDISECKKQKIQLIEREERFKFLFENTPFACHFLNSEMDIIDVNSCWEILTGYSKNDVLGKKITEFIHPEWVDHFHKNYSILKSATNVIEFQFPIIKRNGDYFHVDSQAKSCVNKTRGFTHSCFCFHPVAEREHEKQECFHCPALSKQKLREISTSLTGDKAQAVVMMDDFAGSLMQIDVEGRIVFANKACCIMFDCPAGSLDGKFIRELASNKISVEYIEEWIKESISHFKVPEIFDTNFRTLNDKLFALRIDWNYQFDDSGSIKVGCRI